MNETIKFRAWSVATQSMFIPDVIKFAKANLVVEKYKNGFVEMPMELEAKLIVKDESCILMQYTGIKDKNGKECFESDLIEAKGNHIFEIVWNKDRWGMADHGGSYDIPKDFEIVGNIYESNQSE